MEQQSKQLLSMFDLDAREDESLINFLNLSEKGADTMVLQFGSHSIKFGLASQVQPFLVPTMIAYPGRKKVFEAPTPEQRAEGDDAVMEEESKAIQPSVTEGGSSQWPDYKIQADFESLSAEFLPEIVRDLRNKNAHMIDSRATKQLKKGNVSYRQYDESNAINCYDDTQKICFNDIVKNPYELQLGIQIDKFQLITNPEAYMGRKNRSFLYGTEVAALHASTEFTIRKPVRYSNLNASSSYTASMCIEDIQRILEASINDKMGLAADKLSNFNVVLIIPDSFIRHHVRHILNMLFVKMGFKSAFVHQEAVMATYAMAAQTACVIDIGSTKTTVSCIDDGIILNKSIIKKHYGGDDISELLYRLIRSKDALHHFPSNIFFPMHYQYHKLQLEVFKEQYTMLQMNQNGKDLVKSIKLLLKEQDRETINRPVKTKKQPAVTQVFFNCSDALLLAPQALFYSDLFQSLRQASPAPSDGDPLCAQTLNQAPNQSYYDPEDLIHDIMQTMMTPTPTQTQQQAQASGVESSTPSQFEVANEAMCLDDMVCRSICAIENSETRKRLASNLILAGGVPKTANFFEHLEERVFLKMRQSGSYDDSIACVEVQLINLQQQQQFLLQQQMLAAQGLPLEQPTFKVDPRWLCWVGGSVVPKLDAARDMWVARDKYVAAFIGWERQLEESRADAVRSMQQSILAQKQAARKAQQEAAAAQAGPQGAATEGQKEGADENMDGQATAAGGDAADEFNSDMVELTFAQEEGIKKEVLKRLKKERTLEGGIRLVREKSAFHW